MIQNKKKALHIFQTGSFTFWFAAKFLPAHLRQDIASLYYYLRLSDDLLDYQKSTTQDFLNWKKNTLSALKQGWHAEEPFHSLACIVKKYDIPIECIKDFLNGMEQDLHHQIPLTLAEVLKYSYQVAGVIGMMLAKMMHATSVAAYTYAIDLGIAMQLTNIVRDIGVDHAIGRCYLPQVWLKNHQLFPLSEFTSDPLKNIVMRLIQIADAFYESAEQGYKYLPLRSRFVVILAKMLYQKISDKIKKNQDFSQPVWTTFLEKIFILIKGLWIWLKLLLQKPHVTQLLPVQYSPHPFLASSKTSASTH